MATRNLTNVYEAARARHRSRSRPRGVAPGDPGEILLPEDSSVRVSLPPQWVDVVEQIQGCIGDIKTKLRTLAKLHSARLKVTFASEEESRQEREIEILTGETTRLFHKAENGLKRIATIGNEEGSNLPAQERVVRLNVMRNLASEISSLSKQFRGIQREFMTGLKSQSEVDAGWGFRDEANHRLTLDEALDRGLTEENKQQLAQIERQASEREREILRIAQSVNELANLFKELNMLVIEQGTIIDRIDYNVDQTYAKVKAGNKELKAADDYSRKSRTVLCMFVLLIICIILGIILIFKHRDNSSSSSNNDTDTDTDGA